MGNLAPGREEGKNQAGGMIEMINQSIFPLSIDFIVSINQQFGLQNVTITTA